MSIMNSWKWMRRWVMHDGRVEAKRSARRDLPVPTEP